MCLCGVAQKLKDEIESLFVEMTGKVAEYERKVAELEKQLAAKKGQ